MKSSRKVSSVIALLALGAIHCNLASLPGGLSNGSSTSDMQLDLLPTSAWNANGGTINAVCSSGANPRETGFSQIVDGVSISTESDQASCCTCAARSRTYAFSTTSTQDAHVQGTLVLSRGQSDEYSVSSMRVSLKNSGTEIASRIVAAEHRANNNCAGSSELPEVLVDANDQFDLDLGSIAPSASFDEVDVDLMGYACGDASNSATLVDMHLVTNGVVSALPSPAPTSAPTPSPSPSPAPTAGTPDLTTTITPDRWGSYASGTIGMDNSGAATIVNNGNATALGTTLEIHTESNNPYGPVAPFRAMDPRCNATSVNDNAYLCTIGDLAPGASTTIAFTFNSFSQTTVDATSQDTNGDANFADNRAVGTVYPQP